MHRFLTSLTRFRSSTFPALLSLALLGCENAPVGAKQVSDSAPLRWAPRGIQAPRPIVPADSVTDSVSTDSVKADSLVIDSAGASSITPAKTIRPKRSSFTLTPADSARWPVPGAPEPLPGAIIPEHRIVAFYGNPLSKRMGILGEIAPEEMLRRLEATATEWAKADPDRKVLPGLHLISVVAQGYPGPAKKYRLQMPDSIVEMVAGWAEQRGWILFLDIQPGLSTVEAEIPHLIKYLKRPYVHLSLDPEFAMKDGKRPGTDWMGRMDASEVNHAVDVLAKIVEENDLPPKVLIVHRFTRNMLTNASKIRLDPRVQVVIDMDGYGPPGAKMGAYKWFVVRHPVQYTGWKLFYKNDKPLMTPEQVLEVYPKPMYIQYQ
ncbi:MAG TPA: hypothetical protein VNO19_07390 [Gemmatimonadales bacterium]|nr:hypothetical protein [Gemmatimonadales bacterium]